MKELPIGLQDFETLRRENMLYVDKTERLLELVTKGRRYFLSRPRRFGKSLTLSTLEAMFSGQAELFKGLSAEKWVIEQAKNPFPVLRFDMSGLDIQTPQNLQISIKEVVRRFARKFQVEITSETLNGMFTDLLMEIHENYGAVAVLIDEYDKPILDNINHLGQANKMREVLRSFYVTLKSCDKYLRFVMPTGISKFSKVGVFSALNNLEDISMDERYGDIVGYTQRELENYFSSWIDNLSDKMKLTREALLERLKDYYDGFSFDGVTRLYNPFSILQCLAKGRLSNYWYVSGSPTFIVKYMKKNAIQDPEEYRHFKVSSDFADIHEIEYAEPESFLYQSGYLTIEQWIDDKITLDYPNEEVRKSILRMYLDEIYHVKKYITLGSQIWEVLSKGNMNEVAELYNMALAGVPYDDFPNRNEFWYRSLFLMLLRGAGIISYAEVHTYKGRADLVIQLKNQIIVLEFKFAKYKSEVEKKMSEGKTQISDREYAKSYGADKNFETLTAVFVANDEERCIRIV